MPYILTVLAETFEVPLDAAGMPGVIAHVRPLDADDLARHFDAFPSGSHTEQIGAVGLVRRHLAGIANCAVGMNGSEPVPFDLSNPRHATQLFRNRKVVNVLFAALMDRANLSADDEKKSNSPSGLVEAPSGATSSAAPAVTSGETPITAGFPTASDRPPISTTPSS